jgi:hypothetical protein
VVDFASGIKLDGAGLEEVVSVFVCLYCSGHNEITMHKYNLACTFCIRSMTPYKSWRPVVRAQAAKQHTSERSDLDEGQSSWRYR